jgi:hypothetical protein
LRIGDLIEAYYADSEMPALELVIQGTENSKTGDAYDIKTVAIDHFGEREPWGVRHLNTDRFVKICGHQDVNQFLVDGLHKNRDQAYDVSSNVK